MLKGKNAIVTGSTSGIGKGIAEALANAGANVMLNGFGDAGEIERQRSALGERGQGRSRLSRRRHVQARGHPRHGRERAENASAASTSW